MPQHPEKNTTDDGLPVIRTEGTGTVAQRGNKKRLKMSPGMVGGIVAGCVVVLVVGIFVYQKISGPATGEPSKPLFADSGNHLFAQLDVPTTIKLGRDTAGEKSTGRSASQITYTLDEGPQGCRLDPDGTLHWTPSQAGNFVLKVTAAEGKKIDGPGRKKSRRWAIVVDSPNRPPVIDPIGLQSVRLGETLQLPIQAHDPDRPPRNLEYRILSGSPKGARINPKTGRFSWSPQDGPANRDVEVRIAVLEAVRGGLNAKRTFTVHVLPAAKNLHEKTQVVVRHPKSPVEPTKPVGPVKPAKPESISLTDRLRKKLRGELLELYDKKHVFTGKEYPTFRRIYARLFELDHDKVIQAAYGKNRAKMEEFFEKYPAVKEELYTAIDPKSDHMNKALAIFAELVIQFPDAFPAYSEAAIATAVTWDAKPRAFSYAHHQRRTKSTMPEGLIGGIENFKYLLQAEQVVGRRVCAMPWEFLVHVVNHPTPLAEREWAIANYAQNQVGIGKCYKDVPYDSGLRDRGGADARLKDHNYSLPEIRQYGGVCAMQADFASRVAKSLGVPGFYTRGQAQSLARHAWIVWVELYNVGDGKIQFNVKSFGRYQNDKYYVGSVKDPKTEKRITDRLLELRLHNIGFGLQNKRHAELIMRTYPLYCKERNMDVNDRLRFLGKVVRLSPGTESAWYAIARMSAGGKITMKQHRQMNKVLDQLFKTFTNFPDFTWMVFTDLIAYRDNPKAVARLYEQLIGMYVGAQRPDLGCKAVLRYADFAVKHSWPDRAIDALAAMILAFPGEGRYVPKMLDRLEACVDGSPKNKQKLIDFYKQLIVKVPKYRQKTFTKYCEKMYGRAIHFFQNAGEPETATAIQAELNRLKAEKEAKKQRS